MNTYTRSLKDGSETIVTSRQRQPDRKPWFFAFAVKVILMCSFIFAAVTCRVMYNARIEALNKEATKIQMRIRKINLISANLRNKREEHYGISLHQRKDQTVQSRTARCGLPSGLLSENHRPARKESGKTPPCLIGQEIQGKHIGGRLGPLTRNKRKRGCHDTTQLHRNQDEGGVGRPRPHFRISGISYVHGPDSPS